MLKKEPSERPAMAEFRDELSKMMGIKPGPTTRSLPALPAPNPASGVVSISADFSHSAISETVDGLAGGPRPVSSGSALAYSDAPTGAKNGQQVPLPTALPDSRRNRVVLAIGLGAALLLAFGTAFTGFTGGFKHGAVQAPVSASLAPLPVPAPAPPDMSTAATPAIAKPADASPVNPDGKSRGSKRPQRKPRGHLISD